MYLGFFPPVIPKYQMWVQNSLLSSVDSLKNKKQKTINV